MKIRAYLALMVLLVLCPVVLFSAMALNMLLESERAAVTRSMHETARSVALLVDRELGSAEAALHVLAGSPYLAAGDLKNLYVQARTADRGEGAWTLMFDENGQQMFNTSVPFGTPLPPAVEPRWMQEVIRSQKVVVSDILTGPVSGKLLTTLNVYAPTSSGKKYVLASVFSAQYFRKHVLQVPIPAEWLIGVLDRQGHLVTRSQRAEELAGKPGRPELVKAASLMAEGQIRHPTQEGVDALQVFTHSPISGWTIAVAAPVSLIEETARRAVMIAILGLLAALTLASLAAAFFGRRLVASIKGAARAASALGRGDAPQTSASSVHELNELHQAIQMAGTILSHERESRRFAEAERERLFASAEEARSVAEAQNQAKDQFLAMLGHEIRNPLSAISGAATIMNNQGVTQEQQQRARAILARQCHNLENIVNDLLDVARVTTGKIMLNTRRLDLADVVRSCVDGVLAAGRARHLSLNLQAEPAWIDADQTRLEQIINNLLGNALKYTREGGRVDVEVRVDGPEVILSVADSGIGIAPDLLPYVFDIFSQGTAALDRAQGGLGIGLALVRKLVLLHGGSVEAASEGRGKGSCFTVRLPLADVPRQAAMRPAQDVPDQQFSILLIEDNPDSRAMMALMLATKGHRIIEADNGPEGIRLAQSQRPDVAVIDIGLPGMTGHEVARQLRASPRTAGMGLIALTGYGLETDRQSAIDAGFNRHLVKPVDLNELCKAIETYAAHPSHA